MRLAVLTSRARDASEETCLSAAARGRPRFGLRGCRLPVGILLQAKVAGATEGQVACPGDGLLQLRAVLRVGAELVRVRGTRIHVWPDEGQA